MVGQPVKLRAALLPLFLAVQGTVAHAPAGVEVDLGISTFEALVDGCNVDRIGVWRESFAITFESEGSLG